MKKILAMMTLFLGFQAHASTLDPKLIGEALVVALQNSTLTCSWTPTGRNYVTNETAKDQFIKLLKGENGKTEITVNTSLAQPVISAEIKWNNNTVTRTVLYFTTTSDFKYLTHIKAQVVNVVKQNVNTGTILNPVLTEVEKRDIQHSADCKVK